MKYLIVRYAYVCQYSHKCLKVKKLLPVKLDRDCESKWSEFIRSNEDVRNDRGENKNNFMNFRKNIESSTNDNRKYDEVFRLGTKNIRFLTSLKLSAEGYFFRIVLGPEFSMVWSRDTQSDLLRIRIWPTYQL